MTDVIWNNKFLSLETKAMIYKSTVMSLLTYGADVRPETTTTGRQAQVAETKSLRRMIGRTQRDRITKSIFEKYAMQQT